jgi:hypothetical protein
MPLAPLPVAPGVQSVVTPPPQPPAKLEPGATS